MLLLIVEEGIRLVHEVNDTEGHVNQRQEHYSLEPLFPTFKWERTHSLLDVLLGLFELFRRSQNDDDRHSGDEIHDLINTDPDGGD